MSNELSLRRRVGIVLSVAVAINLVAAVGALALDANGLALGVCAVAYLLGVRHAFDADHIAAIDNVTRRLRDKGQRPVGVGLFFSLGHSTVVLALTVVAILAARSAHAVLPALHTWGVLIGTAVSAAFLTAIGVLNLRLLARLLRRRGLADGIAVAGLNRFAHNTDSSWKMFPLGLLFGLGFDTASEIALLALSITAAHEAQIPLWGVMLLPILFAAGMALTDTIESLAMFRLYDWAIADRDRTLRLNTAITGLSVVLALGVALYQWIGLYSDHMPAFALPMTGSSLIGILATALLLGFGTLAWMQRRQQRVAVSRRAESA